MNIGLNKVSFWVKSAIALVVVFCLFLIINSRLEYETIKKRNDELTKEIAVYTEMIEEKEDRLSTDFDRDYIERYANENLGLYRPDVVIFFSDLLQ